MLQKLKILVIDDENLIRKALCLASQSRGHDVQFASDGETALKLWLSFHPDLIFLDLLLPDTDGLSLLKKVPEDLKATCVIISAHDQLSTKKVKEAGAELFIQKPFPDIFQMVMELESLVFRKREKVL